MFEFRVGSRVDTQRGVMREVAVPMRLLRGEMRVFLEFPGTPVEVAGFPPPDTGRARAVNPVLV